MPRRSGSSSARRGELIGVYSKETVAVSAAERLSTQPGFRDEPNWVTDPGSDQGGFLISRYLLDEDNWQEGHMQG
jgi:hypothetical protein